MFEPDDGLPREPAVGGGAALAQLASLAPCRNRLTEFWLRPHRVRIASHIVVHPGNGDAFLTIPSGSAPGVR